MLGTMLCPQSRHVVERDIVKGTVRESSQDLGWVIPLSLQMLGAGFLRKGTHPFLVSITSSVKWI